MQTPPVIVPTGVADGSGKLTALEPSRKSAHLALVVRSQAEADVLRENLLAPAPARIVGAKPLTCPDPGRGEAVQRELRQAAAEFLRDVHHILR